MNLPIFGASKIKEALSLLVIEQLNLHRCPGITRSNRAFFMPCIFSRPVRVRFAKALAVTRKEAKKPLYEPRRISVVQATNETGKKVTIAFGPRYGSLIF
jgi:hypothetical protein